MPVLPEEPPPPKAVLALAVAHVAPMTGACVATAQWLLDENLVERLAGKFDADLPNEVSPRSPVAHAVRRPCSTAHPAQTLRDCCPAPPPLSSRESCRRALQAHGNVALCFSEIMTLITTIEALLPIRDSVLDRLRRSVPMASMTPCGSHGC